MRAHKCLNLKDRISPTRSPLKNLALWWEASWDLLWSWEVALPTALTWCVAINVSTSKIVALLTLYLENCQALYTPKSANSISLWGPIFCSICGRRLHVIYIYIYIHMPFNIFDFLKMVVSIHIGFRYCGKKTISVIVDYSIKARQINLTTVIYVMDVELLDGGEI